MPTFIITGESTTAQTLTFGHYGIITGGGALATSGNTVTVDGYARIAVQGTISAFDADIVASDGAQIVIGAGGVVTVGSGALTFSVGASSNIVVVDNAGTLAGSIGLSLLPAHFGLRIQSAFR